MKMKWVFLLGFVASARAAITQEQIYDAEFQHFKERYGKTYGSKAVEAKRREIYIDNSRMIVAHNARYDRSEVSYRLKMNQFGDMPHDEFLAMFGRYVQINNTHLGSTWIEPKFVEMPDSVDWRERGAVTRVKNQGSCGSSWAFAATGAVEGQMFRKTGKLISLSEQSLIDCSKRYGNYGCDGGNIDEAFETIRETPGIVTEDKYPYQAKESRCRFRPQYKGADVTGYVNIPPGNEHALTKAVATYGPIAVSLDIDGHFKFYQDGVYSPTECSSKKLSHAMLVVGYGQTDDRPRINYYIVKNSWGKTWGKEGYVFIARNANNKCGIASEASFPLI
ncbi:cathepsin L1-like isoform X1 [Varroa jacobsoni]|uniref:Cathepsin L n=1 Tax=Varroa destructor TaxID=109461 RepID=A0A7M7JQN3_VARDE|nr:cathepsin L1-like isoform X2 [Varroa destructor]XP_022704955.1 cathepsin L1-like isoform X1 [Varroa jacobsoni]